MKSHKSPIPRRWKIILPAALLSKLLLVVLVCGAAVLCSLALLSAVFFGASVVHIKLEPSTSLRLSICTVCTALLAAAWAWFAGLVPELVLFRWNVSLPAHWRQLTECRCFQLLEPPRELIPLHAGLHLLPEDQRHRQEYFVSALLWAICVALIASKMMTWVARAYRPQPSRQRNDPDQMVHTAWYEELALHLFCAMLSVAAAGTGRMDMKAGVCWEVYLLWLLVTLGCSLLRASYFVCCSSTGRAVPDLAKPVVASVLPLIGEHLDTFKDWLFIGLALTHYTWPSILLAGIEVGILTFSSVYMNVYYPRDMAKLRMPVRAAFCGAAEGSFLTANTSPAKLAIALTEDLPQACIQSISVLLYKGSSTQHLFIALSCGKIILCFGLRPLALEQEGRYGDSYQASVEFYRAVLFAAGALKLHSIALWAQTQLAKSLGDLGKLREALQVQRDVLAAENHLLGREHPGTVDAQEGLAWILGDLGRHEEAVKEMQGVVAARRTRLGPDNLATISSEANLAWNLGKQGKHAEARDIQAKVLSARLRVLKPYHCDILDAQSNLAESLGKLRNHEEALKLQQEVFDVRARTLGPKHPRTLRAQGHFADTLRELGRFEEALDLQETVLETRREVLTPKHPDIISAQESLALTLEDVGRHEDAVDLSMEVQTSNLAQSGSGPEFF